MFTLLTSISQSLEIQNFVKSGFEFFLSIVVNVTDDNVDIL